MDVEGGLILTEDQMLKWFNTYPDEFNDYVNSGLLDPETGELSDIPEWMWDGDPDNGPFDFELNPSQAHWGF